MQITLTKVFRSTKKKDGTPLIGKNGRPYTKLAIKTNEHGDRWLSGFDGKETQGWKEGDTVDVIVEEKGEYLNFSVPKKEAQSSAAIEKLIEKIDAVNTNALRAISMIKQLAEELERAGVIKRPEAKIAGTDLPYPVRDESNTPNFDKSFDDEDLPQF